MFKVLFARFPYGGSESFHVTNWMIETIVKAKKDHRISEVLHREYDDTPITMTRNLCLVEAIANKVDYVVMVDSDMSPDLPLAVAKPFWDSSWEFMMEERDKGPCTIAAPYCGPPPSENVYVFRWCNYNSNDPGSQSYRLDQFSREEAATRTGIEEVAALPTGLIIIDMRALEKLPKPYFAYEWEDATESKKASTEDVFFTRNLTLLGIPQYCNWFAWAGHVKRKVVSKPWLMTVDDVRGEFAESIRRNLKINERHIEVGKTKTEQLIQQTRSNGKSLLNHSPVWRTASGAGTVQIEPPVPNLLSGANLAPQSLVAGSIANFANSWHDDEEFHRLAAEHFSTLLYRSPSLHLYRVWCESRSWGFSDRSSYHLFKLLIDDMPAEFSFLEIGVHRGQSVVLAGILARIAEKKAKIVGVSTFDGREMERFDPNANQHLPDLLYAWNHWVGTDSSVRLVTITGDSTLDATVSAANSHGPYDIVFIDGGHEFEVAFLDISNYSPMVRPGGFLVIDDCGSDLKLPQGQFPGFQTVTEAAIKSHLPMAKGETSRLWEHVGSVGHIRVWRMMVHPSLLSSAKETENALASQAS